MSPIDLQSAISRKDNVAYVGYKENKVPMLNKAFDATKKNGVNAHEIRALAQEHITSASGT